MAGIYLHIPFCKTRCIYCDFYSTTHTQRKTQYIHALCQELTDRRDYLKGDPIRTIYFGGGTPSQLDEQDFKNIFNTIAATYDITTCEEITLEANPDDLTAEYIQMLRRLPFNRISIGIQTFDDVTLQLLRRRHNAANAIKAVEQCRNAGFQNISIDLIYGLPDETEERWTNDLQQAIALNVEHISAYHLTYETGTPIYDLLQAQRIHEIDEEQSLRFFSLLTDTLHDAGYIHYEISNFCKPGLHAKHNTSYWQGIPYLGCGASAHSFDCKSREWNVSSLEKYIKSIENGHRDYEHETLDAPTRYNEYIMTALRTCQGISTAHVVQKFGPEMNRYLNEMATPYIIKGKLENDNGQIRLTRSGIFISNSIISDLMFV